MGENFFRDYSGVKERVTEVDNTATSLEPNETLVLVKATTGNFNLSMPEVAKAKGKTIDIHMISRVSAYGCTIVKTGQVFGWSNLTLDAMGESYSLRSNGFAWIVTDNAT